MAPRGQSQPFGPIQKGSWGSMLTHGGSCWVMSAQVGLKLAPRWLKIGLCWLKLAPRCPRTPPKASQVPQDEAKMAPRWLPNRYVLASWWIFRNLLPDICFPLFFCFLGALKASNLTYFGTNFPNFLIILGILGHVCPKRPQDSLKIAEGWPT